MFLFIKIYPFFGISLAFVAFDLAKILKRRANKSWTGMAFCSVVFLVTAMAWVAFRGDKNADFWFISLTNWLQHR